MKVNHYGYKKLAMVIDTYNELFMSFWAMLVLIGESGCFCWMLLVIGIGFQPIFSVLFSKCIVMSSKLWIGVFKGVSRLISSNHVHLGVIFHRGRVWTPIRC